MKQIAAVACGLICYLIFFATFLYAVGFVTNLVVPRSIDVGPAADTAEALLVDVLLLGLFAVPHSVMARQAFKKQWTRLVPAPLERSTYVLVSSLLLALLFWQWRPLPDLAWDVAWPPGRAFLHGLSWAGWAVVLASTFLTNHFELFGLRQVYLYVRGQPYAPLGFQTPLLYRWVRHPLMLGFIVAFWSTPTMTAGRLLFAAATTAYILIALPLEERDLVRLYGKAYEDYQRQVGMLLPKVKSKKSEPEA